MDTTSSASPAVPLLFLGVIVLYAAVYYSAKWMTARVSRSGPDAGLPRWTGLGAMLLVAYAATAWMRATFVDPEVYASLDPFLQGQYEGRATGPAVLPAVFATFVILVKIWRARKRRQALAEQERARNRPSPKW